MGGYRKYRHKTGIKCGCEVRSVPTEDYEQDFVELIKLLHIKPEMIEVMAEMSVQADYELVKGDTDLEQQKKEALDLCQRRINAAITLYGDGHIDYDEYRHRLDTNEREIRQWESRTTETQKLSLEFAMCVEALDRIVNLWEMGDNEDRQGFVRNLFSYIVYDLETRRITDFRLKPWADQFLTIRWELLEVEKAASVQEEGFKRPVPPYGVRGHLTLQRRMAYSSGSCFRVRSEISNYQAFGAL